MLFSINVLSSYILPYKVITKVHICIKYFIHISSCGKGVQSILKWKDNKNRGRYRMLNSKLLWKSTCTLSFTRLLLILIQFTGWRRKSNLQGWVGTLQRDWKSSTQYWDELIYFYGSESFFIRRGRKKIPRATQRALSHVSRIRE